MILNITIEKYSIRIDHNYSSEDSSLWGDLPDDPPQGEQMVGDMGHMGGLINPAPGEDNTEQVFQIPVGLPSLERGRRVKKGKIEKTLGQADQSCSTFF